MRKILFRGKRTDTNKWVYGTPLFQDGYVLIRFWNSEEFDWEEHLVSPDTIGQYTGQTDRNGKKIFEGDICQTKYKYIDEKPFVVEWNNDDSGFYWRDAGGTDVFTVGCTKLTTVIGNIHDNPELLEQESER